MVRFQGRENIVPCIKIRLGGEGTLQFRALGTTKLGYDGERRASDAWQPCQRTLHGYDSDGERHV